MLQGSFKKLDWENLEGNDYPFNISKPLPLITRGQRQIVPVEYFINNDLKYLQGGVSTMTYTMSTTKTNATQYDLPGIEDMVDALKRIVQVQRWHINHASFFAQKHYQEYRHGVLAKEKMEKIGKEKSSLYDQGHQQAAKERIMMRSLEKFVGERLYGTDLRLLQRTI
nr:hypothetical protein [Tanacetum cinerariifolium]